MIQNVAFRRKVLYLCVIALLLFPLYMIGRPATGDPAKDPDAAPGGTLAQLRADYGLSQAELGEIDPASESMKLATLGMRGVAVSILWKKANDYKRTENWEALVATVNQMAKLQPNYVSVWEFQSHNLSYNISVEHDDYRFRYLWVKKGIEFLIKGTQYNRREPRLFWTVGWYTGQKFGRADEHTQFRRLFRDDTDFHLALSEYVDVDGEGRGADSRPDSWLVSRLWYLRAYSLVDNQGASLGGKSPHIFFADGPKARMNYAATIETEGYLDEQAEYAWRKSAEEWAEFGDRIVPTSWGVNIRLNDREKLLAEFERLQKELDEFLPGVRDALRQEKRGALSEAELAVVDLPPEELQDEEAFELHFGAIRKMIITEIDVAERAPNDKRAKAFRLADRAMEAIVTAERVGMYRSNVNFDYWRTRCLVEQKPETVAARRHVYQATQFQEQGELEKAESEYDQAWELWTQIIKDNPSLMQELMAEDLFDDVRRYLTLLEQLEKRLAADFALMPLLEMYGEIPEHVRPDPKAARTSPADAETSSAEKPAAKEPAAKEPAAKEPAAKESAAKEPAAKEPAAKEPAAKEPAAKEPAAKEPAAKEPAAKEPAAKEPAAEEPAAKEPAAKEPAAKEPAAKEPAAKEPAAKEPAAKEPAAKEAAAKEPADPAEPASPADATSNSEPADDSGQ